MKKETFKCDAVHLMKLDRLDPITYTYIDYAIGKGMITIVCYGKAWTSYWGSMGEQTVLEFFKSSDVHYLAKNLSDLKATIIDYDAISREIGHDVERDTLGMYEDELVLQYGFDWYMDLPQTANPDYEYLCRIIKAVQESI